MLAMFCTDLRHRQTVLFLSRSGRSRNRRQIDEMVELHNGGSFLPSPNRIQSAAMSMHWLKARAESKAVPEQLVDGFTPRGQNKAGF